MFSDIVRKTLEAAGWTPERRVSVQAWVETLSEEGFTMHSGAVALLENFGGLVIEPPTLEGKLYRRCNTIEFEVLDGPYPRAEYERVEYWEQRLQTKLAPVGELSGAFTLLVAEDGRIFTYYHNELWQNGDSFEDALENNLIVANRKALEIGVIDEPLVFSDTVRTTLEAAGWTPERRVSVQPWVETLSEEGFTMHPGAVAVLENFGGLVIEPRSSRTSSSAVLKTFISTRSGGLPEISMESNTGKSACKPSSHRWANGVKTCFSWPRMDASSPALVPSSGKSQAHLKRPWNSA